MLLHRCGGALLLLNAAAWHCCCRGAQAGRALSGGWLLHAWAAGLEAPALRLTPQQRLRSSTHVPMYLITPSHPIARPARPAADGVLNYSQDTHRQRTVDWCDATGGTAAAFDFTTKGILQEAVGRREYWRLIDSQGRPPGMAGIWPSRAVTFLENHDTGGCWVLGWLVWAG